MSGSVVSSILDIVVASCEFSSVGDNAVTMVDVGLEMTESNGISWFARLKFTKVDGISSVLQGIATEFAKVEISSKVEGTINVSELFEKS